MSRLSRALAIACVSVLAGCAGRPDNIDNACEIFDQRPGWYRATKKAEKRWDAPIHVQLAIIRQESSFDADARPKRGRFLFVFPGARPSSAYGYPQAVDDTWDWYRRATGRSGADRDDFGDAADFVAWYVDQSNERLGIAHGDAQRQYLAYHEGHTNYRNRTYRKKNGVQRAAAQVERRANAYAAQLRGCEDRLGRGIPLVPFI